MSQKSRSLPVALVVSMRPRQWLKNVLVFAAPLAAGELLAADVFIPSVIAFVAFCLLSSATYLINDVRDVAIDREHPTKRYRPIPAGQLPIPAAVVAAVLLALIAFGLAVWVDLSLAGILVAYLVVTLAYSFGLKNEPVIELGLLAMGFLGPRKPGLLESVRASVARTAEVLEQLSSGSGDADGAGGDNP